MNAIAIECPCCHTVWALAKSGHFVCNKCGQKIEVVAQPPPLPTQPPPFQPRATSFTTTTPVPPPPRKQTSVAAKVAAVLGIVFLCALAYTAAQLPAAEDRATGASNSGSRQPDMIDMQVKAERLIKNNLKAPSTAKFPGMFEQSAYKLAKTASGTYILKGWVDAQNGFGAMIRSDWYVEFRQDASGLSVVNFEIARK
jgi:hypothetical protein